MTWANKITIGRIILVPVFVFLLIASQSWPIGMRFIPLLVFLIAAFLDILDGYLARKNQEVTRLGSMLDPFADKLMMISALFIVVFNKLDSFYGSVSPFLFYMVLLRELILIVGAGVLILLKREILVKPRLLGKAATFVLVLLVVAVLAGLNQTIIDVLILPAFLFVFLSLILYIMDGIKQLRSTDNKLLNSDTSKTPVRSQSCYVERCD
jgi:CDP-diacylglycerol--glycerol-3-phosphate 3-phosphatidyltransferase